LLPENLPSHLEPPDLELPDLELPDLDLTDQQLPEDPFTDWALFLSSEA
jgi:hypothetical protein